MKRSRFEEDEDVILESTGKKNFNSKYQKISCDHSSSSSSTNLSVNDPSTFVPDSTEIYDERISNGRAVLADASPHLDGDDLRNIIKRYLPNDDRRAFAQTNKFCLKTAEREDEVF